MFFPCLSWLNNSRNLEPAVSEQGWQVISSLYGRNVDLYVSRREIWKSHWSKSKGGAAKCWTYSKYIFIWALYSSLYIFLLRVCISMAKTSLWWPWDCSIFLAIWPLNEAAELSIYKPRSRTPNNAKRAHAHSQTMTGRIMILPRRPLATTFAFAKLGEVVPRFLFLGLRMLACRESSITPERQSGLSLALTTCQ